MQRRAVDLYEQGLPYRAIAAELHLTVPAAKRRIRRARQRNPLAALKPARFPRFAQLSCCGQV